MKRGGILLVVVVVGVLYTGMNKRIDDIPRCPGYENVMYRSQAASITSMSSGGDA